MPRRTPIKGAGSKVNCSYSEMVSKQASLTCGALNVFSMDSI